MAEAQALALCVPFFRSRTSPQILGPLCTLAQSAAVCAQWLQPPHAPAPLLWTPSKPGEALVAQRSQGKNLEVTAQPLPRWMLQRQNVCL